MTETEFPEGETSTEVSPSASVVKDAEEYRAQWEPNRKTGWRLALLVARCVQLGTGQGQRSEPRDNRPKVSARQFADQAGTSNHRISRHLTAWDKAAAEGHVPPAVDLSPGQDVPLPNDTDLPFTDFYDARKKVNPKPGSGRAVRRKPPATAKPPKWEPNPELLKKADQARQFKDERQWTDSQIAERLDFPDARGARRLLAIAKAPEPIKEMIGQGKLGGRPMYELMENEYAQRMTDDEKVMLAQKFSTGHAPGGDFTREVIDFITRHTTPFEVRRKFFADPEMTYAAAVEETERLRIEKMEDRADRVGPIEAKRDEFNAATDFAHRTAEYRQYLESCTPEIVMGQREDMERIVALLTGFLGRTVSPPEKPRSAPLRPVFTIVGDPPS